MVRPRKKTKGQQKRTISQVENSCNAALSNHESLWDDVCSSALDKLEGKSNEDSSSGSKSRAGTVADCDILNPTENFSAAKSEPELHLERLPRG
jgi:hypothetical protein